MRYHTDVASVCKGLALAELARIKQAFRTLTQLVEQHVWAACMQVPFGSKRAVAEHALRMAHLWRIYRGEAAVLAGDPAAALAHAEALRQAFEAPCLGSLWGLSESAQFTALLRTQPAVLLESKRALAELPGFGADYVNRLMRRNPGLLTLGAREVETRWHALVAATDLRWEWRQERRMWMDLDVTRAWNYITGPKSHDIGTVLEGADEQRCARLHYVDAMCEKSEFRCSRHSAAELLLMRTEMLDSVAARAKYAVPFAEWRCRL